MEEMLVYRPIALKLVENITMRQEYHSVELQGNCCWLNKIMGVLLKSKEDNFFSILFQVPEMTFGKGHPLKYQLKNVYLVCKPIMVSGRKQFSESSCQSYSEGMACYKQHLFKEVKKLLKI